MQTPRLVTVSQIFQGESRYYAPIFQRFYEWGENEFFKLLDDIENASSKSPEFLGAIVLQDIGKRGGPGSPTKYLIVDGQQRLTTLYMLIIGLAWIDHKFSNGKQAKNLTTNYLSRPPGTYEGLPNLVPTTQDRKQLWNILKDELPIIPWQFDQDPQDESQKQKINQQWKRIQNHLKQNLLSRNTNLNRKEFNSILESVLDHLQVVTITLDKNEDANSIFAKLNARGIPLHLSDLVRNDVFSRFVSGQFPKAKKFYHDRWLPFEKKFPHYSFDQYFPIFANVTFDGKTTKAEAFPKLQELWSTMDSPDSILDELEWYSDYYCSLTKFKELEHSPKSVNYCVERISRMPTSTVTWPFILKMLEAVETKEIPASHCVKSLKIIESFLVRRALMGWEPTGLHAVFKTLWNKTHGEPNKVRKRIFTRTIKCPKDLELKMSLFDEAVDTRVILPYVFQEWEADLINIKDYDPIPEGNMTIEHILPQNLSKPWRKIFSKEVHRKLVGTIGNLAPLSGHQNKSIQDKSWATKKTRFKGSNWKTTQKLSKISEWSPSIIEKRNKEMAVWVNSRWPDPAK